MPQLLLIKGKVTNEAFAIVNTKCSSLECFQEKPSWCRNEKVCQGRKSVKRFERSNGQDTALYKNVPLPFIFERQMHACF